MKRILLVFAMVLMVLVPLTAGSKTVVHHTAAFGGELELLKSEMTEEYGNPEVISNDFGREYFVWETGDNTRVVGSLTKVGMENATLSTSMILDLPDKYYPDLATHGGICGNVWEEGFIFDVYAVAGTAFITYAEFGPEGPIPRGKPTWNPVTEKQERIMWFMTDPVLTNLVADGFLEAKENPEFDKTWEASGLGEEPELHRGYIQASSDYFVANDDFNYLISEQFRLTPDTDPALIMGDYNKDKTYEVGGLDMESSAVVWAFRQANIPVAVMRYPSDLARNDARHQINNFGDTASAVGGYTFFYGLKNVVDALESGDIVVEDGKVVKK